jgi:energy-coupling factor transporter transmembrane protein EcfT
MSVDVSKEQKRMSESQSEQSETPRASPLERLRAAIVQINWPITLITAVLMAIGWCILFLSFNLFQILAGIVPVTAGLFIGRKVKQHLLLHGIILGIIGFLLGLAIVSVYGMLGEAGYVTLPQGTNPETGATTTLDQGSLILIYLSFSTLAMIPFPAFGAVMAGRSEQRNRQAREQEAKRGGKLERPSTVRTLEDLQGLSLPQLGFYVSRLYQKKGFTFQDYRFIDKDKHLNLEMSYEDEPYLLRLSVSDKVRPGTIETLSQEMRERDIQKGLVITSTEFSPEAQKKPRKNIVLIDGQTLFDIAEG